MKTIVRVIAAFIALVGLACCTKDNPESPEKNPTGNTLVTLTANQENTGIRAGISSGDSKVINWTKNDVISVIDGAGKNVEFKLTEGDGTSAGIFKGEVTQEADNYMALYPYQKDVTASEESLKGVVLKSEQTAVPGSFDPEAALMMSATETGSTNLSFKNIVGFVKVTPTVSCVRITLVSNNTDDKLAGTADISMSNGEPIANVTANASSGVSIVGNIEAGKTYYIAIYPTAMPSGFRLVFTTSDGQDTYKNTAKALEIKRNLVTNLGRVEGVADEYPYVTFKAASEQTFKMTLAEGITGLEYSVGDADWESVVSDAEVKFGGDLGALRLRGKNPSGTAVYKEGTFQVLFSQIGFADENVPVGCTGDIRTLIDWENYGTTSTKDARFFKLFQDCTSLTTAPELPATELADRCYSFMFSGCKALKVAPELPAMELADYCYAQMFGGCTALTEVPELPATKLADSCYSRMFQGCTSLTKMQELPAMELANSCYYLMFSGCTELMEASALPAGHLPQNAYYGMFLSCSSLTEMPLISAVSAEGFAMGDMFEKCSNLVKVYDLKVESFSGSNNCQWMFSGCASLTEAPVLPAKVVTYRCYAGMFSGCKSLKKAPELPAETISDYSYQNMFAGCSNLESGPDVLPANKVCPYSYESMFKYCSKLTKAPKIMAEELAHMCFASMFADCVSLIEAPHLPATTLATYCYCGMFGGCIAMSVPPDLPAMTLAANCYLRMFNDCTALSAAPVLPATTLSPDCYNMMFGGCVSLTEIPDLPAKTLVNSCYMYMFRGCTGLTKVVLPEATMAKLSYGYMFQNCSNLAEVTIKVNNYDDSSSFQSWLDGTASQGTIHIRPGLNFQSKRWLLPSGWTVLEDVTD